MSQSLWDLPLASANGLPLTNDDCYLLLDAEFSDDLLKTFPCAAATSKLEEGLGMEVGEYTFAEEACSSLYPPSPTETKPTRAQLAADLLQQLDFQCKQENIFSNWLEEKVELPVFEGIPTTQDPLQVPIAPPVYAPQATQVQQVPQVVAQPQPTEELLLEFESVYGAVELTHLTPPQSPPGPATQLLLSYAQQAQCVSAPAPPPEPAPAPQPEPWQLAAAAGTPYDDRLRRELELQTVEELFGSAARPPLAPSPQHSGTSSSSASPRSSPPSSPRSSGDEEWSAGSSRPKPYQRAPEDRRSRKKEQNKNAATRYRQKKKAEIEVLLTEERGLRARHSELGTKRADLQREICYLKGLMRELFKAKGLIK